MLRSNTERLSGEIVVERRMIQRFEVLELLGCGGMGQVYRAHDPRLDREVAIKVLADPMLRGSGELSVNDTIDLRTDAPKSADSLLSEARMMARLSHQNVLHVYEVGLGAGSVFLVMEHIDGTDLRVWLTHGSHGTDEILEMFGQAARGLAAAHAHDIVHRDFKPENVLVGRDGRARVADFGLSTRITPSSAAMVRIDEGRGTPKYMAPELWRGAAATTSSDVFAFCTACHDALHRRDITPRLREVLTAGTAEDPAMRPTMSEIIGAIEGRSQARAPWITARRCAAIIGVACAITLCALGRASSYQVTRSERIPAVTQLEPDAEPRTEPSSPHYLAELWFVFGHEDPFIEIGLRFDLLLGLEAACSRDSVELQPSY
jgi:serine/threonine protein kinase